ncbi:rod shape-determining protein MreD [Alkalibacter saccharofermentans]|uniref:rod shape-determining protein MreD n=1 Tax=Alkalibacter saccharofermentans TaxID=235931 RepID=UPI0009324FFF|nr:rod shape-determining protein MreD [Alkalibacter saccharofermentans]
MKAIGLIFILLFELVIQATFFQFMSINGHYPDLVLITLVVIGVFYEKEASWKYGFIIGVLRDILFGRVFGVYALSYTLAIVTVSWIGKNIFKESFAAPVILFPIGVVMMHALVYFTHYLLRMAIPMGDYISNFGILYWVINLPALLVIYTLLRMLRHKGILLNM